jgi:tetratricopeptide (TPR) repeat protein
VWRLEATDQLPLPETVQGIIAARLDTLSPQEKRLLQDAAVLGKVGWLGALAALGDLPRWTAEQRLHALERRELLRRERRSQVAGERQYAFRHVLVRDVAYSQLPRAARADRHRRAAQWIEALSPDRAEDRAELLAHHYQAALEYARAAGQDTVLLADRARLALREAGDRALDLNASTAAARWYAAALELWPPGDSERPRLLFRLGRARYYADEAGGDVLAEARDQLLAIGDSETAAEAEALLGHLAWSQGHSERASEHLRRAATLIDAAGPSRAKAFVQAMLSGFLGHSGQLKEAIRVGRQALRTAEALGLEEGQARALGYIGGARVAGGDFGGLADVERAVTIAVKASSPYSAQAHGFLASLLIALGDLAGGFAAQAAARQAAERFGLTTELRWLATEQVVEDYLRGRWAAALSGAGQILARSHPPSGTLCCRLVRGRIRLALGDLAGALADATGEVELAETMSNEVLQPALALRAHVLLAAGRIQEAATTVSQLLAVLGERGTLVSNPDWSGQLAVVLHTLGRGTELLELLGPLTTPTPWLQGAVAIAHGRFDRAADLYAQIGSLPDEAFARLQAAKQLLATGRRAEGTTQLQRVVAFYREVQASAYLREAEMLLAATA